MAEGEFIQPDIDPYFDQYQLSPSWAIKNKREQMTLALAIKIIVTQVATFMLLKGRASA